VCLFFVAATDVADAVVVLLNDISPSVQLLVWSSFAFAGLESSSCVRNLNVWLLRFVDL